MITNSDLNISNEGYVKKDFYQVYPEIVELVHLLSTVWDPENTNESDPGVVLLKLDAFITDKLNYNIDKNILEAFITSATQEEAVRKICEMMGYDIKYYNSATTKVYFMWTGEQLDEESQIDPQTYIYLPKFTTVLTNDTNDISYVLTEPVTLTNRYTTKEASAIEGELVDVNINTNDVINVSNIDDKNRFYLPEKMIAENGIWIINANDNKEWERKPNLNTELKGTQVWKFGYDSTKNLPYIQFPDDYASLFGEGVYIKYIRTSGVAGNIKANTLTQLVNSKINIYNKGTSDSTEENTNVDASEYLTIKNLYATNNGCDVETIDEAYNGYKKTVGTFQTLTSCRDYSNAIYNMVVDEKLDNTPLVSNCQVSDIRDELNYAKMVANYGTLGTVYNNVADEIPTKAKIYDPDTETVSDGYAMLPRINDFDLLVYPLTPIKNAYTKTTYEKSFKPLVGQTQDILFTLKDKLDDYKTISHKIKTVNSIKQKDEEQPLYLYKNYYKLKAKIITNNKVNNFEITQIKNNIYEALYKNFNPRNSEYGQEIPYDTLLNVIQNADSRIKLVLLDEPKLSSAYMLADGTEQQLKYTGRDSADPTKLTDSSKKYLNYISQNVLAGKIPLFNYNNNINVNFNTVNSATDAHIYGGENNYAESSSGATLDSKNSITYISSYMELAANSPATLGENESVQMIAPKLITKETYPMYVNYFIKLNADRPNKTIKANTPFKFESNECLYINYTDTDKVVNWIKYYKDGDNFIKETWTGLHPTVSVISTFSGILESNIDLEDSVQKGSSWAKEKDDSWPTSWIIPGMYSLKTSEEIYVKELSSAYIKQPAYIYWLSNANNTLIFNKKQGTTLDYECVLNDGEYFFYTNQAKTDLLTLGPGTRLTYHATVAEATESRLLWKLSNEVSITKEDVIENGIGAFANSDWIYKNSWNNTNYLKTEQMDSITLGYKDSINSIQLEDSSILEITSDKWYKLNSLNYTQSGTVGQVTSTEGIIEWLVRPVLNVTMGPHTYQKLNGNNSHKIKLYTSWYSSKDQPAVALTNVEIKNLLKQDPEKLIEHIYENEIKELSTDEMCLQSSLLIQKSGGQFISVHTIDITGSNKDNLLIYPLDSATPMYSDEQVIDIKKGISITNLSAENISAILPVYIPLNNFGLFTFYYAAQNGNIDITVCDSTGSIISGADILTEFNSSAAASNMIENISEGLHIIRIDYYETEPVYLQIKPKTNDVSGEVTILSYKLVDFEEENTKNNTKTGVNFNLFGFAVTECENFLNNFIKNKYPDFYATAWSLFTNKTATVTYENGVSQNITLTSSMLSSNPTLNTIGTYDFTITIPATTTYTNESLTKSYTVTVIADKSTPSAAYKWVDNSRSGSANHKQVVLVKSNTINKYIWAHTCKLTASGMEYTKMATFNHMYYPCGTLGDGNKVTDTSDSAHYVHYGDKIEFKKYADYAYDSNFQPTSATSISSAPADPGNQYVTALTVRNPNAYAVTAYTTQGVGNQPVINAGTNGVIDGLAGGTTYTVKFKTARTWDRNSITYSLNVPEGIYTINGESELNVVASTSQSSVGMSDTIYSSTRSMTTAPKVAADSVSYWLVNNTRGYTNTIMRAYFYFDSDYEDPKDGRIKVWYTNDSGYQEYTYDIPGDTTVDINIRKKQRGTFTLYAKTLAGYGTWSNANYYTDSFTATATINSYTGY